ncbi:MAG TPA: hypothetical protein VGN23_16275 [Verrucomicrobiae bacterium]|jgi:hypothetical protein
MSSITNLSAKQLRQAAKLKDKISELQSDLDRILGGSGSSPVGRPRRKRKPMSAAAKAKIAAAARARWKKAKAAGKNRL